MNGGVDKGRELGSGTANVGAWGKWDGGGRRKGETLEGKKRWRREKVWRKG